jgi:hypothetical protein
MKATKTLAQGEEELPPGPLTGGGTVTVTVTPMEDIIGEQRFLPPCSAEGESQAIMIRQL